MNKLVSVIIPVYNREKYIEECLNSVFEQTYQNFEIILVDDGSTDNTLSICEYFAKKDTRIKILAGEHKGVSPARNLALDNAKGEYIFFLDSDDVIHTQTLQVLLETIGENTSIAIISGEDIKQSIWDDYIWLKKSKIIEKDKIIHYTNLDGIEKFFNGGSTFQRMGGFMFIRDYIGNTRFKTDLHIGEDVYFIYENIIKGSNVAIVEEKGYYWRWHDNKLSGDVTYEGFLSRFNSKELLWKSEEKIGRNQFANKEKSGILKMFIQIQKRNKLFSLDSVKTRKVMREYKRELWPAFSNKMKIHFINSVYLYWLYFPYMRIRGKIKKRLKDHKQ